LFLHYNYLHYLFYYFYIHTKTTVIYTLSLHDALPISRTMTPAPSPSARPSRRRSNGRTTSDARARSRTNPATTKLERASTPPARSEEHTSELQSRRDIVCRLLLEKKKKGAWRYERPYQ